MKLAFNRRALSAFTLIEVVISATLMAMILSGAYVCFSAGMAGEKLISTRAEAIQSARVALTLIGADLRAACPLDRDYAFLGMRRTLDDSPADNIDFATHRYTPRRPGEGDYCQVSYFLDKDRETGQRVLWRRRNPIIAIDPLSGGRREEIARGVSGLRFEYYDGFEWYENWGDSGTDAKKQKTASSDGNQHGMPEAVRVTLWIETGKQTDPKASADKETAEPPLVFQTVARLNLASRARGAAGGGSTNNASGSAPATAR